MPKEPERGTIYGPIEMTGYHHITLCEEHEAILLDGTTFRLPAGTKLVLLVHDSGGPEIRYETGSATKSAERPPNVA